MVTTVPVSVSSMNRATAAADLSLRAGAVVPLHGGRMQLETQLLREPACIAQILAVGAPTTSTI